MFLTKGDYFSAIEEEDLDIVVNSESVRLEAEIAAQQEIESYLRQRFDVAQLFLDVNLFVYGAAYVVDDNVFIDAEDWDSSVTYSINDLVVRDKKVYFANTGNTNKDPLTESEWTFIGNQYQVFTCTADNTNVFPNDTSKWGSDPRKKILVRYHVDIALYELHSRVSPRNIPTYRIDRRDDAINWLKSVADPRKNITPDFPLIVHDENKGNDISWNSAPQFGNANDLW